jgi:hypothetical protein
VVWEPGFEIHISVSICAVTIALSAVHAQSIGDDRLAHDLADETTRQAAVASIVSVGRDEIPLLLRWAETLPARVDEEQMRIGLADAFGELCANDAIPFLIRNISLRRTGVVDLSPWLKTPEHVIETFPAVAALIKIGPEASRALIRAWTGPMKAEDRVAAIFVVSRLKGFQKRRRSRPPRSARRIQSERGLNKVLSCSTKNLNAQTDLTTNGLRKIQRLL